MSARITAFEELCKNYPYAAQAKKLKPENVEAIKKFIAENDALGHLDFEYKANRWLVDNKEPKKTIMWDLLVSANARVHVRPRGTQNGKQ